MMATNTHCSYCEKHFDLDDGLYFHDEYFCNECSNEFITACDDCDELIGIRKETYYIRDTVLCENCFFLHKIEEEEEEHV